MVDFSSNSAALRAPSASIRTASAQPLALMICAWASPCAATLAAAAWPTDEDDDGGGDDEKVSRRQRGSTAAAAFRVCQPDIEASHTTRARNGYQLDVHTTHLAVGCRLRLARLRCSHGSCRSITRPQSTATGTAAKSSRFLHQIISLSYSLKASSGEWKEHKRNYSPLRLRVLFGRTDSAASVT